MMKSTERRIADERRIVGRIVDDVLAAGYRISYSAGDDWPVALSRDRAAIMAELHSTDEAYMTFRDQAGKRIGGVYLVYGNSPWEVIADHTDTPAMRALLAGAEALADTIEAAAS